MTKLDDARAALAEEFVALNPQSPEEINNFYVNSNKLKGDLDAWHETQDRKIAELIVCAAVDSAARSLGTNSVRVLDVGAGAGHDLLALRQASDSYILHGVEPNFDLRIWIEGHGEGIVTYGSINDVPADAKYNVILNIDVLEHLIEPELLLDAILPHLEMGGIIVESSAVHDLGTPLHLRHLRGWSPARWFDAHGFVTRKEVDRTKIWQRVRETRGAEPSLLVCAYRDISTTTVGCITKLIDLGWRRSIHHGDALVSRVRSIAVSKWYREDAGDVFLMVDDDIEFTPQDADKVVELARRTRGIGSALYPVRGGTHFASRLFDTNIEIGPNLDPIEIKWAGTGFFAVHRDVVKALIEDTPLCVLGGDDTFWPMFAPFIYHNEDNGDNDYLSEDWAFCERARQKGFKVYVDRTVVLKHYGKYAYSIENMDGVDIHEEPTETK